MTEDIYVDNNATTRLLPPVKEELERIIYTTYGNPSSPHSQANFGRELIDEARETVARFLGSSPGQILFTSCGSESNSIVLQSLLRREKIKKNTVVTSSVEHSSVKNNAAFLEKNGYKVFYLPVDRRGFIDLEKLALLLRSHDVAIVSIIWAHNETGVIQPLEKIIELAHEYGALIHTDAAQLIGRQKISVWDYDVDFLTFTGHKLHAPKGIGVLYAKETGFLVPLIIGGEQEFGLRAGTENLLGIGALRRAIEERMKNFDASLKKLELLRDSFEGKVLERVSAVEINGDTERRTPNTSNLMFKDLDGRAIVARLDMEGVICSQTSACTSQIPEPSPALRAMGLSEDEAFGSIRFSFGVDNREEHIEEIVEKLVGVVKSLRQFSAAVYT